MKTTLELPDDLMRRIKIRAAEHDQKLKDMVAQLLELGLSHALDEKQPDPAPQPVRLRGEGPLSIEQIEAAISAGRD